jgi:hypothetical protein
MPCKPGLLTPPLAAALLIAVSAPLAAQEASLQDCQRWKDKIDELTYLRKKGGSVRQVEEWKRQQRPYEEKFREYACRKYGKQIK